MSATTSSTTDDSMRPVLRSMWASVAPGWEAHATYTDVRGAAPTAALLDRAAVAPADRVLELACGPGSVGLAAANRVGPDGHVVLSDVVPEMAAIAGRRAAALGITNVSTAIRDIEEIDDPDDSYDAVVCREGVMFATDQARACAEMARVVRPGGRVAIATWGPQDRNPWLGLVLESVSEQVGHPVPPPGMPGPFALSDAARVHTLLADAGLEDVSVDELDLPLRAAGFDEWWTRTCDLAGPMRQIVASLPDDSMAELTDRARAKVEPYATDDGLVLPGVCLIASARKA